MRRICDRVRMKRRLSAIRLLLSLCSEYRFRLHIVHLATCQALDELRAARAEGLPVTVETCPHYLHFSAEEDRRWGDALQVRAADSKPRKPREIVAGAARWSDRSCGDGSFSVPSVHEAAGNGKFQDCLGRYCESFRGAAGDVDRRQPQRFYAARYRAMDGRRTRRIGRMRLRARGESRPDATRISSSSSRRRNSRSRRNACITGTRFLRTWAKSFAAWLKQHI